MKIGKQPARWGSPSAKFLEKQQLEESSERRAQFAKSNKWKKAQATTLDKPNFKNKHEGLAEEAKASGEPIETGHQDDTSVRLYLDDERPCPERWTLARNSRDFFKLLKQDDVFLDRVTHISLDWYLGERDVDGVQVVTQLAEMFFDGHHNEKPFLPNLKAIGFHSSDRDQAKRMHLIMHEVLDGTDPARLDKIRMRLGLPRY